MFHSDTPVGGRDGGGRTDAETAGADHYGAEYGVPRLALHDAGAAEAARGHGAVRGADYGGLPRGWAGDARAVRCGDRQLLRWPEAGAAVGRTGGEGARQLCREWEGSRPVSFLAGGVRR